MIITRLLRWWMRQLAALLPPRWRQASAGGAELLVDETADGIDLHLRRRSRVQALDTAAGSARLSPRVIRSIRRVRVRPLANAVLVREVELPAAAASDPRSALELNMDRYLPFHAGQVCFAFNVAPRRRSQPALRARLAVVPLAHMRRLLAPLEGMDLQPRHELEAEPGDARVEFLFEPPARSRAGTRLLTGALAALNVALLALLVALPWQRQGETLRALEERVQVERRAAQAVGLLEQDLTAQRARLAFLSAEAGERLSRVLLLEELSRLLPDDCWLMVLDAGDHQVRLQGLARRASALIGVLQRSSVLGAASFASPIVRDPASGMERFDLRVQLSPPGPDDSTAVHTVASRGDS